MFDEQPLKNDDLDYLVAKLNKICKINEKFFYTNTLPNYKEKIFVLIRESNKKSHVIKRGTVDKVIEFLLDVIEKYGGTP